MRAPLLIALATLTGCPQPTTPDEPGLDSNFGVAETQGTTGCDNLLPDCFYPFPSDAHLDVDGHLALSPQAVPATTGGADFSVEPFARFRGFGTASPIVVRLPGAAFPDDLVPFDSAPSLDEASRTILIDATTGERIPHWFEPDSRADVPVYVIRPAVPLPRGTTVVVGLRGLTDTAGDPWPSPEPFVQLRDQQASTWRGVHARRPLFDDVVFPALEEAGWARDEVQLAWSFPVRTGEEATASMLAVRDAVFDALGDGGPAIEITSLLVCEAPGVPEGCPADIAVIADGLADIPSVVEPPAELGVRRIRRDDAGVPVVSGVERWPFRLQIPYTAFDGDEPVPVLQYGHGFLGTDAEADNSWLRGMANRLGFAILSCDMQGMNTQGGVAWVAVLSQDGGRFPFLEELAQQGVANQLAMQRMVSTTLTALDEPAFERDDGSLAFDPDTVWYHGNSQGGSVGTVLMGTSLDVTRGVLGVPGSGYPLLLHRGVGFDDFLPVITQSYPEPDAIPRFLALLGTGWDDFDPLTFAPHIHGDPLPGTPDHEALLHVAKEDRQVLNEASFILGRASGSVLMTPAVRPVFGLPEQTYPASPGVALVEVDFGIPDDPTPLDPPDGGPEGRDTHGWLRQWGPAQDQAVHFLATGEVIDVCDGVACEAPPR